MTYGGRFLTPNAHRSLLQAWRGLRTARWSVRMSWRCVADAVRWQLVEWPLKDKRSHPWWQGWTCGSCRWEGKPVLTPEGRFQCPLCGEVTERL